MNLKVGYRMIEGRESKNKKVTVLNCDDMDRISAIIIYNDEVYEADNHQFALQEALLNDSENILSLSEELKDFDYVADNVDDVAKLTSKLDEQGEIFCFDVYEGDCGKYLVAHSKEAMSKYINILSEYAEVNSLKFGYFERLDADEFVTND